jgi:hypothetical protein
MSSRGTRRESTPFHPGSSAAVVSGADHEMVTTAIKAVAIHQAFTLNQAVMP